MIRHATAVLAAALALAAANAAEPAPPAPAAALPLGAAPGATPSTAPARFHFDTTPGRLPRHARPTRYRLRFDLDPREDGFGGEARIDITLRREMPALVLHAEGLQPGAATLAAPGGRQRALRVEPDPAAQLWRLVPADGGVLRPGRHVLHIGWRGQVQRSGEGLFRVDAPAGAGPMLFTQLQAVYARTLFPAFDEPAFRAVFDIEVRAPRGLQVESNMPARARVADGTHTRHRFAPTPPMPSYLVALAVGRFDTLTGRSGSVPLRFLTAPGKAEQARYALQATQALLPYYRRYFGLPYALPKLDQLAVPGVREGAMEDWGLISYNEGALLVDAATSGPESERWVFSLAAHEIAHQWFGNLVTAASWEEIWLNEAFATWMENKATDHFNPAWQVPLDTRRHLDRTMVRDATAATRAIRSGAVDEQRVASQFDDITYNKGGAVLSMLEQWLGPATFQRGLAAYMRERRHSNATAGDLWHHLSRAAGRDVAAVAASWTDQPGLPLVSVRQHCVDGRTRVHLRQQRFMLEPGLAPQRWLIPVALRQGPLEAMVLLGGDEAEHHLAGCADAPLLANAGGRGYYRVAYDEARRVHLAAAFPTLAPADRMVLLSDAFALAQAGAQPLADYLALLKRLPRADGEGAGALYAQAGDALRFLDEALAGLPAQARVRALGRAVLAPALQALGWAPRAGEPAEDARLRGRLVELLARFDDAATITTAARLFDDDATGRAPLHPALRPGVLAAVAEHATPAQFQVLLAGLRAADGEEARWHLSGALATVRDPALAAQLLQVALDGTLPPNIASGLPGRVGEAGVHGALAYDFTRRHFEALSRLAGTGPFGGTQWLLPSAAAAAHDPAVAETLLADQQRLAPAGLAEAARVAAHIRLRAAVREREAARLQAADPNV